MPPPPPPEEITQLMQFIAEKAKNVKSPMNVKELCRQFKEETGSSVVLNTLCSRIKKHRQRIHEMDEFGMELKVKLILALSAPIDAGFLVELKKVAEVEVDDQQRIIHYKQKDGRLELSAKYIKLSMDQGERRDREIIQFLADKSKSTDTPVADDSFLKEFKKKTGCPDSIKALETRYRRVKKTIYQSAEIDENTKIKMIFISNAKLPDDVLEVIRRDAVVEVDEEERITKYKSKDGSLELEGSHGLSTSRKSVYSDRWQKIYQKANENESEEEDDEDTNCKKDYEEKRIDLFRFLIKRTKNTTSPLRIKQLAKDYKKEFKSSEPLGTTESWIRSFRKRIHETNQFDISTKVKMLFALSASIDAKFLKELQICANVELDVKQRIKKYKANNGSLELEGDHSLSAKAMTRWAEMKKKMVVNVSSESEKDEEDSSESDGSDEEKDEETVGDSTISNQTPTSSSVRKSDRLRKSRVCLQNTNKKRQLSKKNSDSPHTRNHARMSRRKKRARIVYSSSETSGVEPPEEDDDEESEKSEDDIAMDFETNNIDNGGADNDYDPLNYHQKNKRNHAEDMDHETTQEIEKGVPKEASTKNDENLEHIGVESKSAIDNAPEERKPENLIEVKTEVPEEPSGGENGLIEPKVEECTREVKQETEKDEEGPSTSSSAKIESMSLLELLNKLRPPIVQYTPALVQRMDEEIKKLREKDKQIPFKIVFESLEMCIQLLNTLEEMNSDKNTTSLPNFFYRLGTAMCTIKHPIMDDFYLKIKRLACSADKKVSLEHIRYVMGKTLDRILH